MLGSDGSGSAWDISSSRVFSASGEDGSSSAWDISSSRVLSASGKDGSSSAWDISSVGRNRKYSSGIVQNRAD